MKEFGTAIDVTFTRDHQPPNDQRPYQVIDEWTLRSTDMKEGRYMESSLKGRLNSSGHHIEVRQEVGSKSVLLTVIDRNAHTMRRAKEFLNINGYYEIDAPQPENGGGVSPSKVNE